MVDPNNPNSDNYDNGRDFEAPVDINRPPLLGNLWEFSKKYLPEERVEAIKNDLQRVEDLSQVHAIEILRDNGNLPEGMEKTLRTLERHGVSADLLTVEEAEMLKDYATNATDEIITEKINTITDAIAKSLNGVHSRRELANLERLSKKGELYERGEIDTSRGFDPEDVLSSYDEQFSGSFHDPYWQESRNDIFRDIGISEFDAYGNAENYYNGDSKNLNDRSYNRSVIAADRHDLSRKLEEWDLDDLLEEGIVKEEDIYVIGPFTPRDLSQVEIFMHSTWLNATNYREKNRAAELLNETVYYRELDAESELLRAKVANEILPNHRINTKNLLSLAATTGLHYSENGIPNSIPEKDQTDFQRHMLETSKYLRKIFKITPKEAEREFGQKAPVKSAKFYEEILKRIDGMTGRQEKTISTDQAPYLTKLDQHLSDINAYYDEFTSHGEELFAIEETAPESQEQPQIEVSPESMSDPDRGTLQNFAKSAEATFNTDIDDGDEQPQIEVSPESMSDPDRGTLQNFAKSAETAFNINIDDGK